MKYLTVLLAVLLTGCATTKPDVQRSYVTVTVPCVDEKDIPARPVSEFKKQSADAPMDSQVQALLIDRERMGIYSASLRALVTGCVHP